MTGNGTVNGSSNLEIAQSNQDLIMSNGKRKKRTWILAGIACVIIVALIVAAIVLLSNEKKAKKHKEPDPQALGLEDVIYGKYTAKSFNGTWVSENEVVYIEANRNLVILNIDTDNKTVLFTPGQDELGESAFQYSLSPDRKFLLVYSQFQKFYRTSFIAKYSIIDLSTGAINELSPSFLQLAAWAPVGNSLVFVYKNSLYYKSNPHQGEPTLIAEGGEAVFQGIADWVYEEEVFTKNKAYWFSPDAKKLAYATINDTKVPLYALNVYGEPGNIHFQYPRAQLLRYPKAGAPNPEVTLNLVDLENLNRQQVLGIPEEVKNKQPILTAAAWASNDTLTAIWMNRVQNESCIVKYKSEEPPTIIKQIKQQGGWLDLFIAPIFSKDSTRMVLIKSQDQGGNLGGYRHLTMISVEENGKEEPLTKGAFVVTDVFGWNHKKNLIYYLANTENDSAVSHLYSVSPETKITTCLTCNIKNSNNTLCTFNEVEFNTDYSKYALSCNGPDIPEIYLYSIENERQFTWEDNLDIRKKLEDKKLPIIKKLTIPVADNFTAKVILRLPADMDMSGNTKYPLLVNVYSGPDSYLYMDKFGIDWGSYLVSNKGIIYASIDGRGSGKRGDKLMFQIYRKFGTVEVIDQINVTRQLQDMLPYVDASRTAIWGWSYGGYAAGMALAMDKEGVFRCGVSVAPVTDWTLYDSVYTERFMGLPTQKDNWSGYIKGMLLAKAEGLKDKMFYLIHGTFDDNVHFQQSMMLSRILEQKDIQFRQMTYPDEDHSLGLVRSHLYHSLEIFLDECFVDKEED